MEARRPRGADIGQYFEREGARRNSVIFVIKTTKELDEAAWKAGLLDDDVDLL
jgi:hypothetical protein